MLLSLVSTCTVSMFCSMALASLTSELEEKGADSHRTQLLVRIANRSETLDGDVSQGSQDSLHNVYCTEGGVESKIQQEA
ncbi:hypothetical protein GQ42DRAFT_49903 [Ramicandelaber brevisporus]|nr:hypothetical protein GQ42DRAFT_49903 [Ramicandelaber brevisporus]